MGKGKGSVQTWIYRLEAGMILFELNDVTEEDVITILQKAGKKLPVPSGIVERRKPTFQK
jgi:ribosomal protein L16/L10AE